MTNMAVQIECCHIFAFHERKKRENEDVFTASVVVVLYIIANLSKYTYLPESITVCTESCKSLIVYL